jgi:hypothetical protein
MNLPLLLTIFVELICLYCACHIREALASLTHENFRGLSANLRDRVLLGLSDDHVAGKSGADHSLVEITSISPN